MTLTFIGGGNMAVALAGGMVAGGRPTTGLAIVEPLAEQRTRLAAQFAGARILASVDADAVAGAALVVLAVKPQQMQAACASLAPFVAGVPAVLSIAAGTRIADIARWLGGYARIVRAMPNTPALVGAGISGLHAAAGVDATGRRRAEEVLAACGETLWVADERMLDAITGVSGSGPAYVFYFLEGLEAAARELGFDAAAARQLAYATFAGAIKLAQSSDADPATLRARVTSKGGTTERAVAVLDAEAVKAKFVAAVKAAAARATELGDAAGN